VTVALVYNARRSGPQTHVLAIGVGGYRHLPGYRNLPGSARRRPMRPMRDPLLYGNLGQLSSPPVSALAVRDRILATDPCAWQVPLGTFDLLIAPHPDNPWPAGDGVTFSEPTLRNIEGAFGRWYDRCDSPGNVAIFYFCGHGMEADEQYVLASDFGADDRSPWHNAIAIDSTIKGLWHCKAETQCVFIDACRRVTPATQSTPHIDARALATYSDANPTYVQYRLEGKPGARDEQAFSKPGEVSYFTEALLQAVLGAAAEEEDRTGAWVVTTGSVASKFYDVWKGVAPNRAETPSLIPSRPAILYRPPDPPAVRLAVGCDPFVALGSAHLSYRHQTEPMAGERGPAPEVWKVGVKAGYYHVAARFADPPYHNDEKWVLAGPPRCSRDLKVL
jgi:hypothetical protein